MNAEQAHTLLSTVAAACIAAIVLTCLFTDHDGAGIVGLGIGAISGLGGFSLGRFTRR